MMWYLPKFKLINTAEDATHTMHNLYTLRGAKTRDARLWPMYLNQALQMWGDRYEVQITMHHWPTWGNAEITQLIKVQRDTYKFMHDQTLHYANMGYTMKELPDLVALPQSLANQWPSQGYYGSQSHNVRAVYNYYLGYFDGNPARIRGQLGIDSPAIQVSRQLHGQSGLGRGPVRLIHHRIFGDVWPALQRFLKHASLNSRHAELKDAHDRRRDIYIRRGERIMKARFEIRPAGHQRDMRIGRREAAVIAPAVDRTGIADARLPCYGDVFIVAEAHDDVRRPTATAVLHVDDAHGQRPRDLAMLVAHENRAELQPALQACDGGRWRSFSTTRPRISSFILVASIELYVPGP